LNIRQDRSIHLLRIFSPQHFCYRANSLGRDGFSAGVAYQATHTSIVLSLVEQSPDGATGHTRRFAKEWTLTAWLAF